MSRMLVKYNRWWTLMYGNCSFSEENPDTKIEMLTNLARSFRSKVDSALHEGLFSNDIVFNHFPRACCGDTCYLLAEFLKQHGIQTIYVCGTRLNQSHAWLVVKDESIHLPVPQYYVMPDELKEIIKQYSGEIPKEPLVVLKYELSDLADGILIDVTADQFGEEPVYVGPMDRFHRKFDYDFAHDYNGFGTKRLSCLYSIITD